MQPTTPIARPTGWGPFPATKRFTCGCVMTCEEPEGTRVRFTVDFSGCTQRHVPLPPSAK